MPRPPALLTALALSPLVSGLAEASDQAVPARQRLAEASTGRERPADLRAFVGPPTSERGFPGVRLERVTTAVPWPRGLVIVDGELIVLARGRHRNAGGIDPDIADHCGSLFRVDPDRFEPVIRGEAAGRDVRENGELFVEPDPAVFRLYDPSLGEPIRAAAIDRPYCTLAWDEASRNLFICGYSGVDLPAKRFRKNATDSILRYDLRDGAWHVVEQHDPAVVPEERLDYVVSNEFYPHHDPATNAAPHGLLNGPDGGVVVGDGFYAVGKDNHVVARYDLSEIRRDPGAGPPEAEVVLGREVQVRIGGPRGTGGAVRTIEAMGASALEARDGHLYIGYRTSSIVLRFALEEDGTLVRPAVGELIAVFEPWDAERRRSANLIDLAFDSRGQLHVACAQEGRVWNVGVPDPERVFDGVDVGESPTANRPYLDLREQLANPRARCGNITFDERDRLYVCSGNYDSGTTIAGVVYRALPPE